MSQKMNNKVGMWISDYDLWVNVNKPQHKALFMFACQKSNEFVFAVFF